MTLTDIIAAHEKELSASDRRLIEVLVQDPGQSAFLSAAKLGDKVGVHAATVVRLAKKLGFSGFPALQDKLQSALLSEADPARRLQKSLQRIRSGDIIAELAAIERENLALIADQVPQPQVAAAARLLAGARSVYVFAYGHASALGEIALRRLRRFGVVATDLRFQGRELAERVLSLEAGDVVFCFSLRRLAPGLEALLHHATGTGAQSILITDLPRSDELPHADLLLSASRGHSTEYQTLAVPMLILNAIVLTMANEADIKSSQIEKLGELISRFEHAEAD
ncbi:MurR/RpiR family transcriptional regulator [Exilibacterium tricleocarpae]|uniref:MurR/RpiR family transcriptional regulator n=1 Tax=Exilibacterium tricleocarpae TaxID=2591008 RepID=A0A545TAN7_9GAMM|nr:MurR/RpiR family transcriptional regulator [Exilibacterium tricleocarpae]TQV74267.1 MurR/RpiR family transcriptional regulator [Exilibacterium tricleocarpae]